MENKHLEFEDEGQGTVIKNKHDHASLGHISYFGKWKQLVFVPDEFTIWSADCLEAVVAKMKELKQ